MKELEQRIDLAKRDKEELNQLILDYLPFIKKNIMNIKSLELEYGDRLSLAMLTFMGCVNQYAPGRGSFVSFASTSIRNRLIDEGKKQIRYTSKVTPFPFDEEPIIETKESYDMEQEQRFLSEEIEEFSKELQEYHIDFAEMEQFCPKHVRSKDQCIAIAKSLIGDLPSRNQFLKTQQLPQKKLAQKHNLSVKTIEKHRKYIVTVALLLLGEYPAIQSFCKLTVTDQSHLHTSRKEGV